jgi:hypothetical protein
MGDPGIWWSLPFRIARGEIYYRDLHLQYGPLSPYLLSFASRLFGLSATSVLLWNWIPAMVLGLLVLRLARYHLSVTERLAVVGMLLGVAIFAPAGALVVYPYCPAAVHALCLAFGSLLLLARRGARAGDHALLAGVLAGLAFCAKQEIGIATMVALSLPAARRSKEGLIWFGRCLAGFLILAALGALVAFGSASAESLRYDSHLVPMELRAPEAWRPLFRLVAGVSTVDSFGKVLEALRGLVFFAALFAFLGHCLARERRASRWLPLAVLLGFLVAGALVDHSPVWGRNSLPLTLSMIGALLVSLLAVLDRRLPNRDFLVGYGLFAGIVGLRTAFSGDVSGSYSGIAHLPSVLTSALLLIFLLPRLLSRNGAAALWTRRIWTVVLLYAGWEAAAYGIGSLADGGRVAVRTPRGTVWTSPEHARFFELVQGQLSPGETTLILPEANAVDALYGVRDVSPFLIHMPGWLDDRAEREILRRVSENPPRAIVLFARTNEEFRVGPFGTGYGLLLSSWIQRHYRVVAQTAAGRILRPLPRGDPQTASPSD